MSICETDEKSQQREENRRNFPMAAQRLDELREVFGSGVRLVWAVENGKQIGKMPRELKR